MIKFITFLILFLIALYFGLKYFSKLNQTQTKNITIGVVVLILLSVLATYIQSNNQNNNIELVRSFDNNATLTCNGIKVHKSDYNFVTQTMCFVGKNEKNLANKIVSIDDCEIEN